MDLGVLEQLDGRLARWANGLARSGTAARWVTGSLARWLSGVEVGLMVWLALAGRRESAMRMLAAVGVVYLSCEALGIVWPRRRPFARLSQVEPLIEHDAERAFPSRHVASGLAMAAIGGRSHRRLGVAMTLVAWVLGLSRVAAGLHYPADVLAGAVLGRIIGRGLAQRT